MFVDVAGGLAIFDHLLIGLAIRNEVRGQVVCRPKGALLIKLATILATC